MAPVPSKSAKIAKSVLTSKIGKHNHQTSLDTPKSMREIFRSVAGQRMKGSGLVANASNLDQMEVDIISQLEERGQTDTVMLEAEKIINELINKGLKDSRWASAGAESSLEAVKTPEIVVEKVVSTKPTTEPARRAARKIAVPVVKRTSIKSKPTGTEVPTCTEAANAPRPQPPSASIPGTAECYNHSSGGAPTGTTPIHPPEIEALLEAERKRAANTSARLEIGSTVLKTLESVILSMKTTDNKEYLDAMNVCLRGALAHFLRTGTTPVPTSLPSRPIGQQVSSSGTLSPSTVRPAKPAVAVPQITPTWATVAGNELPNHPTPVIASGAPKKPTPPTKKSAKTDPSSSPDN